MSADILNFGRQPDVFFPGLAALKNTWAGNRAIAVSKIYRRADAACAAFGRESGLACPPGCGLCCSGFVPDLLPPEVEFMAIHLISSDPARAREIAEKGLGDPETCPFFRDDDGHCSVYAARPLICRLFGFSGLRDRAGLPVFRLCKHMACEPPPASMQPPLMSDYAAELVALSGHEPSERRSLTAALPESIARILHILSLTPPDRGLAAS